MVVNVGTATELISFKDQLPKFISFAASFFIMMALWKVHYNFFRRTNYVDNWIIGLNMIFLFTVLFYIFPVKGLLDSALLQSKMSIDEFSSLFQVYSIGFSLMFLSFTLLYYRAYKKDKDIENPFVLLFYTRHFLIFVLVGLLSTVLANLKIGLRFGFPGFIYGILGPLCYWHSVRFQRKHKLN